MPIRLRPRTRTDGTSSSVNTFRFHYRQDYEFETRIVRFHNIFGPLGTGGVDERKPLLRCVAKLRRPNSKVSMKLRFGAMASKRGPSATLMIALRVCTS